MRNPYILPLLPGGKQYAIIQGYVVAVKDRGDVNMILLRQDTMDSKSKLISVAAWALADGQSGTDKKEMAADLKGRFVVCIAGRRLKEKDGKVYENYDLKYLIKAPQPQTTA